jgi:hypothetical protein
VIELLPACSDKLKKGSLAGVACRTEAVVDSLEWDLPAKSVKATISSLKHQELMLQLRRGISAASVDGRAVSLTSSNSISLHFEKKKSLTVELSLRTSDRGEPK